MFLNLKMDDLRVLDHTHIHKPDDNHEHTFDYFKSKLNILAENYKKGTQEQKRTIATEINNLRDGILDYPSLSDTKKTAYDNYIKAKKTGEIPAGETLTSLENAIKPPPPVDYVIPNKQETDHNHKHIHINKGPEQSSDARDVCELSAEDIPKDIHGIMVGDEDIKTYKYDDVNKEHQLILSDNIKSKKLETIVESLRSFKFTNFYTGHLEFNLEYIENKEVKSKPYKINLLGKSKSVLELEKPLSLKSKSYLKNIKVEGYYFDSVS